jgi:hypothetical protein
MSVFAVRGQFCSAEVFNFSIAVNIICLTKPKNWELVEGLDA